MWIVSAFTLLTVYYRMFLLQNLPSDAHVICIDQAGHGDSTVHDNDVLSFMGFVHRVYQVRSKGMVEYTELL